MTLTYQTLDGDTVDRVAVAIARLREFEPPEGYYVAFSGGKDSIVTLDLVRRAGVKHDAHFHLTTVDPPEVVRFVREHYPDVEVDRPKKSMFRLIVEHRTPPTRIIRYCCKELKEGGGNGRHVVTGVRWAESNKRRQRRMVEVCQTNRTRTFLHPIIDWSSEDVWQYIRDNAIPYPSPYDNGYTRIGCIMCPMKGPKGMLKDAANYPRHYQAYLRAFGRMLKSRIDRNMPLDVFGKTPEDVMDWWIGGKQPDRDTVQANLWDQPSGCFDQEAEA
jgi:phosphoadenosine phosphosulfate reductase